jgi:tetrapyrrole methylase family protein / MazG family protein
MTRSSNADIYLVGLGMYELRHLTLEALEIIKNAKVVYHLTDKHEELRVINPNTRDLADLYSKPGQRTDIYEDLAKYTVDSALSNTPVVLALDGNPMFFSDISWKIAALGKKRNLLVEAVPGVSCIDVLPVQLGFDPGDIGFQVFEATQLVLYDLAINPYLSTLILQVGYFWRTVSAPPLHRERGDFAPLVAHLCKFFPKNHPAIFIQSAYSKQFPTGLLSTSIASIDEHRNEVKAGMTLYVPRSGVPVIHPRLRLELNLPPMEHPHND